MNYHNIFRIQDKDSIMCGFYVMAFSEYRLAGKEIMPIHFLRMTIKRMTKRYISILMVNRQYLRFRLKK